MKVSSQVVGLPALMIAVAFAGHAGAVELGGDDGSPTYTNNVAIGNGYTQIIGASNSSAVGYGAKIKTDPNSGQNSNGGVVIGNDAFIGLDLSNPNNAYGTHDTSRATAIGANAQVHDGAYTSTAIGAAATVNKSAHESTAIGGGASIGENSYGSTALGHDARVAADTAYGVAIGKGTRVNHGNSVAIGFESTTTRGAETNYVGFGTSTPQTSIGEVAFGTATGNRTITGVAAGKEAHDAVNVQQLSAVSSNVSSILGGGSTVDSYGVITAPSYSVQGTSYFDVGSAFSGVDSALTDLGNRISEEAGQAGAVGLAASSIRFDDRPGKISIGMGVGSWGGEDAFAFGGGYTSTNQRVRANVTGATSGNRWGVGGGLSFTLN